jgi:8-oxo-dGTP pyrophosphatase MutT (NUDIX family)
LGSAAAIFDAEGRILLVKHTYGRFNWELPGGLGEPHESPMETVMREVREETGLDVDVKSLTGCYYEPAEDLLHFVFRCEPAQIGAVPSIGSAEISEWRYWLTSELPRPISDFTIRRIQDATQGMQLPMPVVIGSREWLL